MKRLVTWGFHANSIHGNKSQGQREKAIKAFKAGDTRVLVATDVAARGIDIPGISHVYNFDLPEVPENYVHRIGRTARAGREGEAIAFCSPTEVHLLAAVEKLMNMGIDTASGERPEGVATKSKGRSRSRGGQGKGGGNRSRNGPSKGSSNASGNGPNKSRRNKHRGPDKANEERSSYFGKSDGGGELRERSGGENRERPREDKSDYSKNKRPGRKRRFGSGDNNGSSEGQPKFAKRSNRNDNKNDGNKQAPVRRKRAGKKRNKKKTAA